MTAHRPARRVVVAAAATVVLACAAAGCSGSGPSAPPTADGRGERSGGLSVTGPSLGLPRAVHRATMLADGRVLFTGGCSQPGCEGVPAAATTALFDGRRAVITAGPRLRQPRISHTATLLADGRVLVAGGYPGEGAPPTASMEVFDPTTGAVRPFGSLRVARADHTASVLPDGRILVSGGRGVDGRALRSVEIVSPSGDVRDGPPLPEPRTAHTATALGPRVLLVGGTTTGDAAVASSARFDARTSRWTAGPALHRARVKHAAVALPDGSLFVIGGASGTETRDRFSDSELLPAGGRRFEAGPSLPDGRYKLTDAVAVLPDGRVVVGGGPTLDVIDVQRGTVRTLGEPQLDVRRSFQTVSLVSGARVLVAGGYDDEIRPTASTWLVPTG